MFGGSAENPEEKETFFSERQTTPSIWEIAIEGIRLVANNWRLIDKMAR